MLIAKSGRFERAIRPFAAVGRMALSNYLFHTIAATFIFYGHGLGLFGQVERTGQLLIVIGIWTIQLIVSPIWLRHFRFGPAEWLWRLLTYGRLQPMQDKPIPQKATAKILLILCNLTPRAAKALGVLLSRLTGQCPIVHSQKTNRTIR